MTYIDIVFQGPPSAPATFVEVENPSGKSISVGEWLQRPDGYWVLRIPQPAPVDSAVVASLVADVQRQSDDPHQYGPGAVEDLRDRLADALTAVAAERDAEHARSERLEENRSSWIGDAMELVAKDAAKADRLHKAITEALGHDPLHGRSCLHVILRAALDKEGTDDGRV